jgi:SAM-dependent methyltransferase
VTELPPESQVWDLMRGALVTRALAIAAELDLAGLLAPGPRSVAELADTAGVDTDSLRRLLRALASDGVFTETSAGVFANTDVSAVLLDQSSRDFAHLFGTIWHRAAAELDVTTGAATFARIDGDGFWAWLARHPDERAAFDRAMVEGVEDRTDRLASVEWRGDETVVDVGGGNGSLLATLLARQPGLRGIVFDLPETVVDAKGLGDRIEFVAGSFFERVPEGDVYVLSTVLHNWPDEDAAAILRSIRAAAPGGGRLVVLDSVVPAGNERSGAKWLDLLMLVLFGSRERDEQQWRELFAGTGFEPVSIRDGLIEAVCR